MIVVCVDRDRYREIFDEKLRRSGGRAIRAEFEEAALLATKTDCDAVLFDPHDDADDARAFISLAEEVSPGFSDRVFHPPRRDPYGALQQLTDTDWARDRNIVVFTHISKDRFEAEAHTREINLGRIQYYSKDHLEIPPVLACVRETILRNPARYIRYDHAEHIPRAITAEWIRGQRELYAYLEPYLLERLKRSNLDAVLAHLPVGFRHLYRLMYLAGHVNNGGFLQYLANALSGDKQGATIVDTLASLRKTGNRLTKLLERAILIDPTRWPEPVVSAVGRVPGRRRVLAEDDIHRLFDNLDQEFDALSLRWIKDFDNYVKRHPKDFIHPGGRGKGKRKKKAVQRSTRR